jgi:tetraacyldisaccharide 4'-kinase
VSALSAVYGGFMRLRRSWYAAHPEARRRLQRPVISVGNLAVGGTGKTPIVAALARTLLQANHRPAILSRGYARRVPADGVVVVSDGQAILAPVDRSGDEAQMLARMLPGVPVLVSADRYLAGTLAERQFGATVHLLDDGFQHLRLARTVDLLVVSDRDLDDAVLPSGRLREPIAAARGADALLVPGAAADAERIRLRLGATTAFHVVPQFFGLRQAPGGSPVTARGPVVAVAAIARPERFFAAVRGAGYDIARTIVFADHHWFTPADLRRVSAAVRESGAALAVTTEKDAVRLEPLIGSVSDHDWAVLPMSVSIEPAAAFESWLAARL